VALFDTVTFNVSEVALTYVVELTVTPELPVKLDASEDPVVNPVPVTVTVALLTPWPRVAGAKDVTETGAVAVTVTLLLEELGELHDRKTELTVYVYVPAATPVSSQLAVGAASGAACVVPHASLVVPDLVRRTQYPRPVEPPAGETTPVHVTCTVPLEFEPATPVGADSVVMVPAPSPAPVVVKFAHAAPWRNRTQAATPSAATTATKIVALLVALGRGCGVNGCSLPGSNDRREATGVGGADETAPPTVGD
jgi:hypothetical protein